MILHVLQILCLTLSICGFHELKLFKFYWNLIEVYWMYPRERLAVGTYFVRSKLWVSVKPCLVVVLMLLGNRTFSFCFVVKLSDLSVDVQCLINFCCTSSLVIWQRIVYPQEDSFSFSVRGWVYFAFSGPQWTIWDSSLGL